MQISTNYSRKINHEQYGGMQYENSSHSCSLSEELSDDLTEDEVKEKQSKMQGMCRTLVEVSVANEITGLSGGLPKVQFNRVLDAYLLEGGTMTSEEYETMSPHQQMIIQAIKRSKKRTK